MLSLAFQDNENDKKQLEHLEKKNYDDLPTIK